MKKILYIFFIFLFSTCYVFADDDVELNHQLGIYINEMISITKKNWNPPLKDYSYNVITETELDRSGKVISCKIYKSSEEKYIDEYAVEAIKKSQPFKPLPEKYRGKTMVVRNTFYSTHVNDMFLVKFIKNDNYKKFYKNLPNQETKKSYKKYINEITNRLTIISPEKYLNRKKFRLNFDINDQGDTENIKIIEPSDSKVFDDKIIKQIEELNISPYPSDLQHLKIKKINVEYKIKTNLLNNSTYYPFFIPLYY